MLIVLVGLEVVWLKTRTHDSSQRHVGAPTTTSPLWTWHDLTIDRVLLNCLFPLYLSCPGLLQTPLQTSSWHSAMVLLAQLQPSLVWHPSSSLVPPALAAACKGIFVSPTGFVILHMARPAQVLTAHTTLVHVPILLSQIQLVPNHAVRTIFCELSDSQGILTL